MVPKHGVLVGPGAAGLLGWDGFTPEDPSYWLVPHDAGTSRPGVIRSRLWLPRTAAANPERVAVPHLVLAFLLEGLEPLPRWPGDTSPISISERFELGFESYLRAGNPMPSAAIRGTPSLRLARALFAARGPDEPPTESFLETRTIQLLRRFGYRRVFRQVHLYDRGRIVNRIDLVVPFDPKAKRPDRFVAACGVPIEADGRAHHGDTFEKDRLRNNNVTAAGSGVLVVTAAMVERQQSLLQRQLRAVIGR